MKQLAQEVRDHISKTTIGKQYVDQIYSQIRNTMKEKRNKRKQRESIGAVVNQKEDAQRKERNKNKAKTRKRRKMETMKMGRRWV